MLESASALMMAPGAVEIVLEELVTAAVSEGEGDD